MESNRACTASDTDSGDVSRTCGHWSLCTSLRLEEHSIALGCRVLLAEGGGGGRCEDLKLGASSVVEVAGGAQPCVGRDAGVQGDAELPVVQRCGAFGGV